LLQNATVELSVDRDEDATPIIRVRVTRDAAIVLKFVNPS
jgi:hypothetical protein